VSTEALEREVARVHIEKDQLVQEHAQNLESMKKMADELKVRNYELASESR